MTENVNVVCASKHCRKATISYVKAYKMSEGMITPSHGGGQTHVEAKTYHAATSSRSGGSSSRTTTAAAAAADLQPRHLLILQQQSQVARVLVMRHTKAVSISIRRHRVKVEPDPARQGTAQHIMGVQA